MYKKVILMILLSINLMAKSYNRIVVLDPAAVEIIYSIGAEKKIVAIAHSQTTPIIPEDKTKNLPSVGTLLKPSLEKIISFKPDLVIVGSFHDSITESLKKYKINYVKLKAENIGDMLNNITLVGNLTGNKKEAEILYNKSQGRLNILKSNLSKKPLNLKGTFVYNATPLMVFGKGSVQNEILKLLGVTDIAESLKGEQPIISPEYALTQNPDFLIGIMGIKSKEDLLRANEFLNKTKAGKNGNIYVVNSNKLLRMSPNLLDEVENIYKFLDKIN